MLFQDLRELKSLLEIDSDDSSEDKFIMFLNEYVAGLFTETLNHDFDFKARTRYYDGTGTSKLILKHRPVFTTPTIQTWVDDSGFFGEASGAFASSTLLTYGTDYFLQVDQDDGTSRSAILVRNRATWNKPSYRQAGYLTSYLGPSNGNVKVTYTAGYTLDTLPSPFRLCAAVVVARLRHLLPMGFFLTSESYEERAVSYWLNDRSMLRGIINEMIGTYRNWKW